MNNKDSIVGDNKTKSGTPKVSAVGQNKPQTPAPASPKDSVTLQKGTTAVRAPAPPKQFSVEELQKQAERATGKKLSEKVLETFQKSLNNPQIPSKQVIAQPTRSVANPVTTPVAPQAPKIEQSEEGLKKLQQQAEKYSKEKVSMDTLKKLVPAFESVQKSINFVAKINEKRDFDDQHYTVPATQSLFSLTANQISGMPFWRG